jgi:hypothetical protein
MSGASLAATTTDGCERETLIKCGFYLMGLPCTHGPVAADAYGSR